MQQSSQVDIKEYIEIFFRRKWLFIVPFSLIFIGSVVASFLLPKKYEATSIILLEGERVIEPLVEKLAISPKVRDQLNTLTARILTWPRLAELANKMNLTKDIKTQLEFEKFLLDFRKHIKVTMKFKDLIYVSYQGKSPYVVKAVTTNLAQMFIDENIHFKSEGAKSAIDFIQNQLGVYRKRLEESGKRLGEYKIEAELEETTKQYELLKDQLSHHKEVIVSEVKKEQNPIISQLTDRLAKLETQLTTLLVDSKEDHPLVIELRREIKKVKEKIDTEMQKTIVSSETSEANPIYRGLEQKLKELGLVKNSLRQRLREIKKHGLSKYKKGSITDHELSALDRDARVNEQIYAMLLQKLETARISQKLEDAERGKKFRIIEPARLPLRPVKPSKKKIAFLGLVLGSMTGFGLIFLFDYIDHSFRSIEDAKAFLNIPYLGVTSKIVVAKDYKKEKETYDKEN